MAINPYVNNYNFANTQNLFNDLVIESIKFKGIDVHYLPRDIINFDEVFGEGNQYSFANTHIIEMYLTNVESWGGMGDIMSNIGILLDNEATFIVSKSRFETELSGVLTMPREGDLIYFPLTKSFFEINHVDHESEFYPAGSYYVWELKTTLYTYDGADIETSNTEIDAEIEKFPVSNTEFTEPSDNNTFSTFEDLYIDDTESNPYGFD